MENISFDHNVLKNQLAGGFSKMGEDFISSNYIDTPKVSPHMRLIFSSCVIESLVVFNIMKEFEPIINYMFDKAIDLQLRFVERYVDRMKRLFEPYNLSFPDFRFLIIGNCSLYTGVSIMSSYRMKVGLMERGYYIKDVLLDIRFFDRVSFTCPGNTRIGSNSGLMKRIREIGKVDSFFNGLSNFRDDIVRNFLTHLINNMDEPGDSIQCIRAFNLRGSNNTQFLHCSSFVESYIKNLVLCAMRVSSEKMEDICCSNPLITILREYLHDLIECVAFDIKNKVPGNNIFNFTTRKFNEKFPDILTCLFSEYFTDRLSYMLDTTVFLDFEYQSGRHVFLESKESPVVFSETVPGIRILEKKQNCCLDLDDEVERLLCSGISTASYNNPALSGEDLEKEIKFQTGADLFDTLFVYDAKTGSLEIMPGK